MKTNHFKYICRTSWYFMCFWAFLGFNSTLFAQDPNAPEVLAKQFLKTKVVVPPSPEAASLGKYGNTPVSYYTGTPSISLPLHTIQGKGVSVPINLSYNATGNKVAEVPSWTGLGWTLSAGGVITRSVIGKPDMDFNYYNKISDIFTFRGPIEDPSYSTYEFYDNVKKGNIDTQSDVYFFNVAGYSGKFYIVPTNNSTFKIVIKEVTDVKIEPIGPLGNTMGFRLKAPTGVIYEFSTTESTYLKLDDEENTTNNFYNYTSSWFLSNIISLDKKEEIIFAYENTGAYEQPVNALQYVSDNYTVTAYNSGQPTPLPNPPPVTSSASPVNINRILDRKYLSTISYKFNGVEKEQVTFTKEIRSEAVCSGRALKEIKVQKSANEVLKFNLEYYVDTYLNRLALNSVKESGTLKGVTSEKPPHIFTYKNAVKFPSFTSNSIDHWGFYNSSSASKLIPVQGQLVPLAGGGYRYDFYPTGTRDAHPDGAQIGMIESIKYPTGGSTEYVFEPHLAQLPNNPVAQTIGGARVKEIRDYSDAVTLADKRIYEYKADDVTAYSCSGVLFTEPKYDNAPRIFNKKADVFCNGNFSDYTSTTFSYSSTSTSELGTIQGSHIGYSRVIEKKIGAGRSAYTFKNVMIPGGTGVDETNGSLLKKEDFNEGGTWVAKTENIYIEDGRRAKSISSYSIVPKNVQNNEILLCEIQKVGGVQTIGCPPNTSTSNCPTYSINFTWKQLNSGAVCPICIGQPRSNYPTKYERVLASFGSSSWQYLDQTITTQYYPNGQSVATTTKYYYDNLNNTQVTKMETVNSEGKKYVTQNFYVHDITSAAQHPNFDIKETFFTKNLISIPLRVESYIEGIPASKRGSVVEYATFNSNADQFYPTKAYTLSTTGTLLLEGTIQAYNPNGLPTKVIPKGYTTTYEQYTYGLDDYRITQKSIVTPVAAKNQNWYFDYYNTEAPHTNLLKYITNENGVKTHFDYDGLKRLTTTRSLLNPAGDPASAKAKTTMTYQFATTSNAINAVLNAVWFDDAANGQLSNGNMFQTTQYFDGLGRAVETVKEKYTQAGQHQKTYMTYDNWGRPNRSYQPVGRDNAGFEALDLNLSRASQPYTNPQYEPSPLNRIEKQFNEDESEIKTEYSSNTSADAVKMFSVDASGNVSVSPYAINQLYKTTLTDENNNQTCVFKDKLGRVILTRKIAENNAFVDTYNVYNDYGNLVMVIPPDAMNYTSNAITANLIFTYKYDVQHRLSEKKIPGADVQKFYYNDRDQVILTQDGNMRTPQYGGAADKHLATRYDELGRVVETGWMYLTPVPNADGDATNTVSFSAANSLSQITYKDNKSLLQQTKYRTLGYLKAGDVDWIDTYTYNYDQWARPVQTEGMTLNGQYDMTVSQLRSSGWAWFKAHQWTGPDNQSRLTFNYSWHDNSMRPQLEQHKIALDASWTNSTPTQFTSWKMYNHQDQLVTKRIGGSWVPAVSDYRFSQQIDYEYNNRNWLTRIGHGNLSATSGTAKEYPLFQFSNLIQMDNYNGTYSNPPTLLDLGHSSPELFTQIIRYDNPNTDIGNVPAQKNGNISQIEWQVAGREKQAFSYTYDKLNRLTEAKYSDIHTGNWVNNGWTSQIDQNNRFNETLTYDKRGNIESLVRKGVLLQVNDFHNGLMASGFGTLDNMIYTYNDKNQVTQIADAATGTKGFKHNGSAAVYTYDANGNLITDSQKGISNIEYNYLNLPIRITFTVPNMPARSIEFIYDATGKKWRKTAKEAGKADIVRDYIGEAEYLNNQQDIIHFTEGYAKRDISTDGDGVWNGWVYKYNLKDHLGNTRVTYCDKDKNGIVSSSDIEQVNHYYGFGLNMEGPWSGADGAFKNQYNGKEWNDDFGLGWNDYGFRMYDPAIGRFPTVDLLAEIYHFQSPYVYAANDPISFIDFMGLGPESYEQDDKKKKDKDGGTLPTVTVTAKRVAPKVNHHAWVSSFDKTMGVTPNQWNNPSKGSDRYESDQRYYTEVLPELFEDVVEAEGEVIMFALSLGSGSIASAPGRFVFQQGTRKGLMSSGNQFAKLFAKYERHIFSADHIKKGIMNLGSSNKVIMKSIEKSIKSNSNLLKEGSNFILTKINNVETTIKVFIKDGKMMSIDAHVEHAKRLFGNIIK